MFFFVCLFLHLEVLNVGNSWELLVSSLEVNVPPHSKHPILKFRGSEVPNALIASIAVRPCVVLFPAWEHTLPATGSCSWLVSVVGCMCQRALSFEN